jgi:hypothetical protein
MPTARIALAIGFFIFILLIPPGVSAETQSTDLAFLNVGVGLEELNYYEFLDTSSEWSMAYTGSFVTALTGVVRRNVLGLSFRGTLSPVVLGGTERWLSNGDTVQRNDLNYRLARAIGSVGFVFQNGLEARLGYWYSSGTQKRKNFRPADPLLSGLVSIERIRAQGIALGLQGIVHNDPKRYLIHLYGDLIVIPDAGPLQAKTTNTVLPSVELHSWGLGVEAGGSYNWTFGKGPAKLLASLQGNLILLYYDGQVRRDIPSFVFVEWPSNFTMGWRIMLQLGGGWFSV